jgi:hypothetical protein
MHLPSVVLVPSSSVSPSSLPWFCHRHCGSIQVMNLPSVVLVPSSSVSTLPPLVSSQTLWQHLGNESSICYSCSFIICEFIASFAWSHHRHCGSIQVMNLPSVVLVPSSSVSSLPPLHGLITDTVAAFRY